MFDSQNLLINHINVQIVHDCTPIVEDWQDTLSMSVESNGSFRVLCAIDLSNAKNTFVDTWLSYIKKLFNYISFNKLKKKKKSILIVGRYFHKHLLFILD